ncbi:MAG: DNA alkylation repair protein [Clostridiaceae bacterium]|jgi:3-methyladenine DNA glycosylase AlkD|nr:DNA alkylation repair protein [Bacillota bacterium]NLN52532.1 DNA alkylation repair protein [Clostridiaceae bacterium]
MNFKQFCSDILILSDPEKGKQMSSYMRDQFEFLGVPAERRRESSKKQFDTAREENEIDWEFVEACWEQNFREFQYVAIDYLILMQHFLEKEDLDRIKDLVLTKSWWDTVDNLNKPIGTLVMTYPELEDEMIAWSKADNIWLRRSAIIFQLGFKKYTNKELLSEIIQNNFDSREFFINKAIGWALREFSKTDPDWVAEFLREYKHRLATISYREATKILNKTN